MKLLNTLSKIACFLPRYFSYFLLRIISFFYYLASRRKFTIIANLRLAFSKKPLSEIEHLARENIFRTALGFWESLRLNCLGKDELKEIVSVQPPALWERMKEEGFIILGVHMGSWEVVNSFLATYLPYTIIARRQKDAAFDEFINACRQKNNLRVIYEDDLRGLVDALRRNINLGLVFDHGARDSGFYTRFFGRQVPTPLGALRLALRSKRRIVPAVVKREGFCQKVKFFLPIVVKSTEDFASLAEYLNEIFEKFIRENSADFLWAYKRFKRSRDIKQIVLSENRPGHLNQALALAEIISQIKEAKTEIIKVKLNRLQRFILDLLNQFCRRPGNFCFWLLKAVLRQQKDKIFQYADAFISCGSTTAALARLLSLFMEAKSFQILRPNSGYRYYDLIILPEHDKFAPAKNVVRIKGALSKPKEVEKKAAEKLRNYLWHQRNFNFKIGVFIGGPLKKEDINTKQKAKAFLKALQEFAAFKKAGLLITTSRRTPLWLEEEISRKFSDFPNTLLLVLANRRNYDFAASGIRGLSDLIIASADSVSMVAEAAASQKTVVVDLFSALAQSLSHKNFVADLAASGYVEMADEGNLTAVLKTADNKLGKRLENDKIVKERLEKIFS